MEICSENDDLDGDVSNFVMMHAEIKRNDDPFLRFLNRDISEKHLRYTDLDSDFKVLTQKMLPELAKLFGYITVHKQRVVSRALLKTIVEMLGSLEREMLVSSMTDFFYQVLGSVTWHAGQSDLESISSESSATPSQPSFSEVALGLQERTGCQPLEVTTVHPCGPGPFGNPFAHQPAAPTAPSTPVPDPVVAKPPASSRTPAPASAKGNDVRTWISISLIIFGRRCFFSEADGFTVFCQHCDVSLDWYQNSPSHIHIAAIQPTSSLYQPSPLQTLDSIDSRVNSYPFLPYFIHQSVPFHTLLRSLALRKTQCRVLPPQDATIDHCPNSIPPFQDAPKCLQRDGPSPYASQKRA
ncbi:hypothetical protein PAPYR_7931 [Paratrimastix pyriformis]|uniref:Uncharacterized protein n=1 Tax=Paratrimastix pyriformis TaxID=342808 RepID=A0ABQ8UGA4_9EUKA|nr:hypothetical protein PAPYR_7931 [Paratrimastix pyriformis]